MEPQLRQSPMASRSGEVTSGWRQRGQFMVFPGGPAGNRTRICAVRARRSPVVTTGPAGTVGETVIDFNDSFT